MNMKEKQIEIWRPNETGQVKAGYIVFREDVTTLEVQRTATGANIRIPSKIALFRPDAEALAPLLSNLWASISLKDPSLEKIEVGIARGDDYYLATKIPESIRETEFLWRDALAGLMFIEKNCTVDSPVLEIELHGEFCYAVDCKRWFEKDVAMMNEVRATVRTVPFQRIHGRVELSYPPEVWRKMIEAVLDASRDNPILMLQPLIPFLMGTK